MLSRRGMPRLSQVIASYGRHGDSMLAHINPQEAELLRRRGGSGTTNPMTGLAEFFASGSSVKGDRGYGGALGGGALGGSSGTGSGAGGKAGLGGTASRGGRAYGGALGGGAMGRTAGVGANPAGGKAAGTAKSLSGVIGGGPVSPDMAAMHAAMAEPGMHVSLGGPLGLGGGIVAGPIGSAIGSALDSAFGLDVGFEIGGTSITEARDRAYGSSGSGASHASGISRGEGAGRDVAGQRTNMTRSRGIRPTPAGQPTAPTTPAAPEIPDWLRQIAGDNLSPIQLRSLIATQGSQGMDAAYRGAETLDYYRKLVKSSIKDYAELLPVEHRYLQDVFGFQYQPTLQDFYRVLG